MPLDTYTTFRDWLDDFIVNYDQDDYFIQAPEEQDRKPVAAWIIEDVFELAFNLDNDTGLGSYLPGYDIKYRDAYQMIQLSLATELRYGNLYECYADENGLIKYYLVGDEPSDADELYSIETSELKKPVERVIVIGYDPPPRTYINTEDSYYVDGGFNLFTFAGEYKGQDPNIPIDTVGPLYDKRIHSWGETLGPELCAYYREGYIEYEDPQFDHQIVLDKAYGDGTGIYNSKNWESVSTYLYKITVPDNFSQAGSRIEFHDKTPRFVELASMGELQPRQWKEQTEYIPDLCQDPGEAVDDSLGVDLPESTSRKFLGVRDVYIYGYKLKSIKLDYYRDGNDKVENSFDGQIVLKVDVDTTTSEAFKLSKGEDYQIVPKSKDDISQGYKIVFVSNVHPDYSGNFGNVEVDSKANLRISATSIYGRRESGNLFHKSFEDHPLESTTGLLKDGVTEVDSNEIFQETIFPVGEGNAGYVVKKVVAVYDWDNPCVALYDEDNKVTSDWLNDVSVTFYPILSYDPPAPTAMNGELLDQTVLIVDRDFTTVQDIENSAYMLAMNGLEKGDIKLTLPFLDEDGVIAVSEGLFNVVTEDLEVKQTTHILSPRSEPPILGSKYGETGGVINSIDYSYQDGSQYLITVNTGPRWLGSSGWDTSLYQSKTERVQMEGIVLAVAANNFTCTVKLEQLGVIECINGSRDILEAGDRVRLTIHNNPVTT